MRKRILPVVLILIVLGIIAYFTVDYIRGKLSANSNLIEASGVIEATTVMLSSNGAGILTGASFDEGQPIKKGQIAATQDDKIIQKQIQVAQANINASQVQIDSAVLQHDQSVKIAEEGAREAYDAKEYMATYNHFVYYNEPLSVTTSESKNYSSSSANSDSTSNSTSLSSSILTGNTTTTQQGTSNSNTKTDTSGYSTSNSISYAGSAQKKSVRLQLEEAINQYKMAELKLKQVKENNAQIEIARANLEITKAQLDLYNEQLNQLNIISPMDGIILNKFNEAGEYLLPGTPVYEVGDLYKVLCDIYIPEAEYGKIFLNQKAVLLVDSYPNEQFTGTVTKISDEAEFIPKNIQSKEDRVTTVYKITLSIENPQLKLKPGMPADVQITIESK
ncbi:MAG: efflux RND transporter periplasmic adaptor subunit [Actinobacteria bacterium]|nr:efflux RND transporter periplasmic adaptor subunit [Actinomycetota bacterium]